jgi:hypothetical protein
LCMLQAAFSLEGDPWRAVCVFSLRCGCDAVGLVSSWAHVDVCICACAKDAWLLWFVYTAAVRPVVEGSGSSGGDSTVVYTMHAYNSLVAMSRSPLTPQTISHL